MSVWTVIVMNHKTNEYEAQKMFGPPDGEPAWKQARKMWNRPVAILKGDFASTVLTLENMERK